MPEEIKPAKMTEVELAAFNKLVDPDAPQNSQYAWDEDFQRQILGALLNDKDFLIQCRPLIRPDYFVHEAHKIVCRIIFSYFDKYKGTPNTIQLVQDVKTLIRDRNDEFKVVIIGELNTVLNFYVPGLETREYYRDKVTKFAQWKELQTAFSKVVELYKRAPEAEDTKEKVHELLHDAMSVDYSFDPGLDYFSQEEINARYDRLSKQIESEDVFVTGFDFIDQKLNAKGLRRGEIGSWIGLSGSGKSLALKKCCVANLHRGKKCLYLSLELDQDAVAFRFDAELVQSPGVTAKNLGQNREIVLESLKEYMNDAMDKKQLVIKQFPGGTMGLPELRAYYSQLILRGFTPDLVIVDYIGEMKDIEGLPKHESRLLLVQGLRGFAIDERVAVVVAMQPNIRLAKENLKEGGVIDDDNIGDSTAQIRPLDAAWSLNMVQDERGCNIGRGFIIKHRDGEGRKMFYIQYDYDHLMISEISQSVYEDILKKYKSKKDTTISDKMAQDAKIASRFNKVENKEIHVEDFYAGHESEPETGEE